GYHYWDIMGFELGFTDLGKTSVQSTYMGSAYSDQDEAAVIDAVIVGTMRITGDISVLDKIGLLFFDADSETTSGGVTRTDSASGVDYTLGLGAKYDLGKQLGLRVEWQRFSEVGKGGGQSHYDVYSAGLVFDIK
ncbi:MAG: outer membrane beta-barrel protein, partial [Pseudomonadota bacterium]